MAAAAARLLTCVSGGTLAGVARWGGGLADAYACGAVQAAVWVDEAGVLHVLAHLSCPTGRTQTLAGRTRKEGGEKTEKQSKKV